MQELSLFDILINLSIIASLTIHPLRSLRSIRRYHLLPEAPLRRGVGGFCNHSLRKHPTRHRFTVPPLKRGISEILSHKTPYLYP